jgi:hypothetical protein
MAAFLHKMSRYGHTLVTCFRAGLIVILMLSACGPSPEKPAQEWPLATTDKEPLARPLSDTPTPQQFQPPDIVAPTRTSPEPDAPAVVLSPDRPEQPVEFSVTASPAVVKTGDDLTLSVLVHNRSGKPLQGA